MDTGLRDRVVLVTGATRGIGRACVDAYAAEGARIAVAYHQDKDAAAGLVDRLGPDRALAVRYDLAAPAEAVDAVTDRWGAVDVLVANAYRRPGVRPAPGTRFEDADAGDWPGTLAENVTGTLRTVQLVLPGMRARGWGRIVLISSHVAANGQRGQSTYGAAKAALHGFARGLAPDAGPDGVLVNVVAPGLTRTEGVLAKLPPAVLEDELRRTPSGRLSEPADVAAAVLFLGSGANGNVTGQVLTVSGGR